MEIIRRDVFRLFQAKERYRAFPYLIILGNQKAKKEIIDYINSQYPAETILSSGTIRKLKKYLESLKGDSAFSENGQLLLRERKS
jgi:hypothetical protein